MAESNISTLIDRIGEKLDGYKSAGLSAFVSSSFQSHSLPLLHIISRFQPETPVYFLNTGFHFPETMAFRHVIGELMGLNIIDIASPVSKSGQRDDQGKFFFVNNPDHCCYLNKVLPMEPVIAQHDVWINGVRRDQTKFRATLLEEEPLADGKLRYHPMLDWTSKMIWEYRKGTQPPRTSARSTRLPQYRLYALYPFFPGIHRRTTRQMGRECRRRNAVFRQNL